MGFSRLGADARLSERKLPGRAVQPPHAQPRFQVTHQALHSRLRQIQRFRRPHEAPGIDHLGKGVHFLEFVHDHILLSRNGGQLMPINAIYPIIDYL